MKIYDRNLYSQINYRVMQKIVKFLSSNKSNSAENFNELDESLDETRGLAAEKVMVMMSATLSYLYFIVAVIIWLLLALLAPLLGFFIIPWEFLVAVFLATFPLMLWNLFKHNNWVRLEKENQSYTRMYSTSYEIKNSDLFIPLSSLIFYVMYLIF